MNKTCPKCAADYNGRPAPNQHDYWCGSTTWNDGDFYQSPECVRRERDQLLERIKRLENAGNDLVWWFCQIESSQLSSAQSAALKQWRDLRGRPSHE